MFLSGKLKFNIYFLIAFNALNIILSALRQIMILQKSRLRD